MFRLRLALALTIALASFLLAATPSFALLGAKTWSATPGIEAEWLFPATGPARVTRWMAQGQLWLRVWARDLDSWTATDQSGFQDPDPTRSGREADTLIFQWEAPDGGSLSPSGLWCLYAPPPTPGTYRVKVTINDQRAVGDPRHDTQVQRQMSIEVVASGDPTIRKVMVSGIGNGGGPPATSGFNYQSDPSQEAYAYFTVYPPLGWIVASSPTLGTGSGWYSARILIPPGALHQMHTVTVQMWSQPPPSPPAVLWDTKQVRLGVYFHHDTFPEAPPGPLNQVNWFPEWQPVVGAQEFIYRHMMVAGWPEPDQQHQPYNPIGYVDWYGRWEQEGYARGQTYMAEQSFDHFFESEHWTSDLYGVDLNGNSVIDDTPQYSERDVLLYYGIDIAGACARHEPEHGRFWVEQWNWEGFDDAHISYLDGQNVRHWYPFYQRPGDPAHDLDRDGDGIKNDYEQVHAPEFDLDDRWSLLRAHSGIENIPQ